MKAAGWKEEGFDDRSWLSCVENDKDDHVLFLQPTPVVTVYETRPQITRYTDEGDCFLDFGRELTSHLEMKAIGKSGQKVEIMYG